MRLALALLFVLGCSKGDKPTPPQLVVTDLQPDNGDPMGQKVVQITGSGFDTHANVEVTFGTKKARAIVVAPDRIQLESPAGAEGEEVEVTVKFPDGRSARAPKRYRWTHQQ
jgi:hypothetical protein